MIVKLKILHGTLQNKRGKNVGADVNVRGPRFVIGSAPDCSMRCRSQSISPHHCEILVEDDGIVIRDLYSEAGTFVNEEQVDHERPLKAGDHIRVGRLKFEVWVDEAAPSPSAPRGPDGKTPPDPVADFVSDMLVEADEEDRARRKEDPESRQFQFNGGSADDQEEQDATPQEDPDEKKKKKLPPKKPPGKLPAPPPFTADNTVEAAEETLKKLFTKDKRKS